jgi:transposase
MATVAPQARRSPHTRPPGPGRGRPIVYPRRDIVDAIRYLDRTGCQWDALPADFPHPKLVYHYFNAWARDGTLTRMHNHLREQVRQKAEDRDRQPTAALVDSQSLRGAETVGRPSRGYDAGKKINGRNATSPSTPAGYYSRSWSPAPTSKTATPQSRCSARCTRASRALIRDRARQRVVDVVEREQHLGEQVGAVEQDENVAAKLTG